MGLFGAWTRGYIKVNGVNLSTLAREILVDIAIQELPDHTHGDNISKVRAGLESWTVGATFLQDFSANKIDATFQPLTAAGTPPFELIVGGKQNDPTTTDPWYKGTCILSRYTPLKDLHGTILMATVLFQVVTHLRKVTSILDDQRIVPLDSTYRHRPVPSSYRHNPRVYKGWYTP